MENNTCDYLKDCDVPQEHRTRCNNYEDCQSKKFYDRYGTECLGVGACCDTGLFDRLREL